MTALARDRSPLLSEPGLRNYPVAASVLIYAGAMVAIDTSGNARPARVNTTDKVVGVNYGDTVDNSAGSAGDLTVDVRDDKVGWFGNSASTDAIARADIGRDCYVADDQTVALTDLSGTRCRAGRVHDVDATNGVGVDFAHRQSKLVVLKAIIPDVSTADTVYVDVPVAGKIVAITSVLDGAITGADAAVTPSIVPAGTGTPVAVTGGALTIANVGSAAGVTDQATPTAANTVAKGDSVSVATDGASTGTVQLTVSILIEAA